MLPLIPLLIQADAPAFMRSPDIHGERIVYTCEGDLWLGDLSTRKAMRLTRDVGTEMNARFSPDGSLIAYDAEIDGIREVYVMPVAGGAPTRLTYRNEFAEMVDWRDSNSVVFRARNYPSATAPVLFTVDITASEPVRLPLEFASMASFSPDGNRFAFTRYQRFTNAWFRYEGGLKNPIWIGDVKNLAFKQVHEGAGSCEFPVWLGDRIYFTMNEGGTFHLGSVRADGGGAKRETQPSDFELRYLQGDGKRLVYERGLGIDVFDPATSKSTPVRFDMVSDLLHTRAFMVPAEASVVSVSIGPTGKRVLVESRGQVVSLPVKEGEARVVLAKDGVRYRYPVYSADGKKIAFIGDESGEKQVYVCDADGSNPKQLTSGEDRQIDRIHWAPDSKSLAYTTNLGEIRLVDLITGSETLAFKGHIISFQTVDFDFSPDSKWIAICELNGWTGYQTILLYDVAAKKLNRVGDGQSDCMSPRFSRDGKYLGFLSRRNLSPSFDPLQNHMNLRNDVKVYLLTLSKETPSPLRTRQDEEGAEAKAEATATPRIDLDGLYGRFVELPLAAGTYSRLEFAVDRVLVHEAAESEVRFYDLKAKKGGVLATAAPSLRLSANGKHVLIAAGSTIRCIDSAGENDTRVGFAGLHLRIDPKAEWKQMYWDAWRLIRDYFYVANMHGANWDALGKKYAALLPNVRSRDELDQLIRWLQAELAISHSFIGPGDVRSLVRPARPSFLGAELEPAENGFYKIKKIYRAGNYNAAERSPLAEPGVNVNEGEYLISVGGRPAKVGSPWRESLLGRAGQVVTLKVNSVPSEAGARSVDVRPAANETRMRWWDWVEGRREYIDKASGGKLAYVYLRAMVVDDMADFIRQYYPQRDKEGLIVDTRFNTGGNISDFLITVLKQTGTAFWNQRNTEIPWTRQGDFFQGPKVCIANEFNYSCGEEFPYYFRAMKLGPVIGRRTRGGEVGSDPGWPLADGGTVSVPNYGMFDPKDGWIIEGSGVSPDIEVQNDPNAWARGKDLQLDRAIQYLLEELKKNPVKRPTFPPDPVRIKNGG